MKWKNTDSDVTGDEVDETTMEHRKHTAGRLGKEQLVHISRARTALFFVF